MGAELGASSVEFRPRGVVRGGGERTFVVGTAGSTSLVLQTILLPLCLAEAPTAVTLRGGTHNPWAPPFDFLEESFRPLLRTLGLRFRLELVRPGFFPPAGARCAWSSSPRRSCGP